jgi:methylenetetrahydrofolate dehydrogenase (NADP+)/methenyltetrahydrofolate cyclohydrolase
MRAKASKSCRHPLFVHCPSWALRDSLSLVITRLFKTPELAEKILNEAKRNADAFRSEYGRAPKLAVVLVGEDPASALYVKKKGETCKKFGLEAEDHSLSPSAGFPALLSLVDQLNRDENVDGILVQSPLPKGWDERLVQARIRADKDVDGFHPENAGALLIDAEKTLREGLPPCTPAGVMEILKEAGIRLKGKRAVVIGRSTIVGKPMALMLLAADATVTICHSKTENLAKICSDADIVIAAIGKPRFVTREFVKPGAVLIDVGINREVREGKNRVVGDVHAAEMNSHAAFLTPVPNGVGPMTIALLLRNTVRAAQQRAKHIR